MDIVLARTFLEVIATGSFVTAAERLHVTQSTVSTRIRTLEQELGQPLFHRSKSGATATFAGEQFERYATTLVRVWHQARHEVALPSGFRAVLSVGAQISLWDQLLVNWVSWMRVHAPDVAIRAERGIAETLVNHVVDGTLDIGVMYTPQHRPGYHVEKLFETELILVSTESTALTTSRENYVYVDWGTEFRAFHSIHYPKLSHPYFHVDSSAIGLQYILANGGAGYLPARSVTRHLDTGELNRVADAPVFVLPAYVIYSTDLDSDMRDVALEGLRQLATGH
ncbi:MAG: LysR family transcriptional regulator [Gammaproteobacteria bacterium]|nr:LysR family transcriptional regulator [Gammaproteobacteria bacterium]